MRILTPPVKTALVFGAGLATLVGLMNCFMINPVTQPSFYFTTNPQPVIITQKQPIYGSNHREQMMAMNARWSQLLAKSGYQSGPVSKTVQSTSIFLPKYANSHAPDQTKSRFQSNQCLILPTTAGPVKARSNVMKLGSSWKELAASYGVLVTGEFWGYSNSRLWLKMVGMDSRQPSGRNCFWSFGPEACEITIVQPFRRPSGGKLFINGWLPSIKPNIPIQRVPVEAVPSDAVPQEIPRLEPKEPAKLVVHPKVAIIIDDVGYWKEAAEELLATPVSLTWAILPFAPYSEACREEAQNHGIEIILHLPLEPAGRDWNPGPGAIIGHWTAGQIRDQLEADLQAVPGVVGINNHMGSAGTQDLRLMEILMGEIKERKLFFVDSRTHALSVAGKLADTHGVPFAKRQIFIDNKPDPESQKAALRKLIKQAVNEGTAIGIAHARPGSVQTIAGMAGEFQAAGVEIVPVSELVKLRMESCKK